MPECSGEPQDNGHKSPCPEQFSLKKLNTMKKWIFLTGLALMLFTACQKDNGILEMSAPEDNLFAQEEKEALDLRRPFQQVRLGEPFTLRINETALIIPDGIRVTFQEVPEDSRCPIGLTCFWEGRAVIQFSFEKYDNYVTGILATPNNLTQPPVEMSVFDRQVKLLEVAPYPEGKRPIPIEKYRVRLVVERAGQGGVK